MIEQLRRDILDWKKNSSKFCDYKCIFTGGRFQNIHHIISFNSLVDEAFNIACLDRRSKVSDYSTQEYEKLKICLIGLHNQTLFCRCCRFPRPLLRANCRGAFRKRIYIF